MTETPIEQLGQALAATEALVAGVGTDQWSDPTPCGDWTVRELLNHLVGGDRLFVDVLRGGSMPPLSVRSAIDHLGDDPVVAYRDAAAALTEAFEQPGVLEQMFPLPIGVVPGIAALHLRTVETLVHGWDIARATGQASMFPDDLAEQELHFTADRLRDLPPERTPFGPPQPVSADAPAIDRLAALLGRSV